MTTRVRTTEAVMETLLTRILGEGAFAEVLAQASGRLAASRGSDAQKQFALHALRTQALTCTAELEALLLSARTLLTVTPPDRAHEAGTLATNAFICAGRYADALAMEGWARDHAGGTPSWDDGQPILHQINLAEADYARGDWNAAWRRLEALQAIDPAEREEWSPLLVHGLRAQRAWAAAHLDLEEPQRAFLDQFDPDALSPLYRAEQHFCVATVYLRKGLHDLALEAALEGQRHAVRASSERNALFLLARVHGAQGRTERALDLYAQGAAHPYRGQGGDALFAWGELLAAEGRAEEAAHAFTLAVARDPESEGARRSAAKDL